MKILITGANGLLGQHLVKLFVETTTHHIIATGRGNSRVAFLENDRYTYRSIDLTDGVLVNDFILNSKPDIVIHTAAMTQVDECEQHPIDCWNINVTATRFLLDAAKQVNAYFIFTSTDFVFDGEKGMYREDDEPNPGNYYGSSKVAAEKAVLLNNPSNAVVRTCLVYGNVLQGNRGNIISWVRENLEKQTPIRVVGDQLRTPTYVEDLAKGILLLAEKKSGGIYHISGEEILTPFKMALTVADYLRLDKKLITEVNALNFSQPAKRPARTGFVIEKAKKELHYQPLSFEEGLKKIFG